MMSVDTVASDARAEYPVAMELIALAVLVLSTAGSLLLVPDLHLADYSDTSAPRGSQQPA